MIIDSNILIYAINADSPKNRKAQEFLRENIENLEVTHQNILETLRVLTHSKFSKRMRIKLALTATQAISKSCQVISPTQTTYYLWLELINEHALTGNRIFDAYLVATALSNGINIIATDNVKDFKIFRQIKVINPFE